MSNKIKSPEFSTSRAVLVGVSDYDDANFTPVPASLNSVDAVYQVLTDPGLCDWPKERVTVIENPRNAGKLASQLRSLAADVNDIFMLYYVGHGTLTPRGELSLTLSDTVARDSDYTGLRFSWIREAFLDISARAKVSILDCCAAGRALQTLSTSNTLLNDIAIEGVYTFAATEGSSSAHVVPLEHQANEMTSFTRELISVIRSGVALAPAWLTLDDIYVHVKARLAARGLPAPNRSVVGNVNRFFFTKNIAAQAVRSEEGTNYLDSRRQEIASIIPATPSVSLPSWPANYTEDTYNQSVSWMSSSFICMSRHLFRAGTSRRFSFEICDLLGPENELIYVKRARSSAPLSHLFNQGLVAVDILVNIPEVRAAFIAAANMRSSSRLLDGDFYPRKVIFALAREGEKNIAPESLFAFSQITLVQTSRAIRSMGVATELIGIEIGPNSYDLDFGYSRDLEGG